jgi:Zn-dependent protease with chaperone function
MIKQNTLKRLKKFLFIPLLIVYVHIAHAQIKLQLEGQVIKKISSSLTEGTQVKSVEIVFHDFTVLKINDEKIKSSDLENIKFNLKNNKDFWQSQALSLEVYDNMLAKGMQYKERKLLEDEALNYIEKLYANDLIFNDSYIEDYLYTLLYKIFPQQLEDGRPGILNILMVKDNSPNASTLPNGTILVNTGLLTTINSEAELIAILAHEVAHFVLDHTLININKEIQREKSAEFWTTVATGMAVATEISLASKSYYYSPGALTMGTALLTYSIASEINERLGLKYSREQEDAADKCAVGLLKFINSDPIALSSALQKIKAYCIATGNYMALSGEGTHPAIDERIKNIGTPKDILDENYDTKISDVITLNAIDEFNNKHFVLCRTLVERNIKNKVAIEDDYLLKAVTNMYMFDNTEKNNEALDLINKAKNLNIHTSIELYKREALIYLRLKKKLEAETAFENYLAKIKDEYKNLDEIKNEKMWLMKKSYLNEEEVWTKKMIYKNKTSL